MVGGGFFWGVFLRFSPLFVWVLGGGRGNGFVGDFPPKKHLKRPLFWVIKIPVFSPLFLGERGFRVLGLGLGFKRVWVGPGVFFIV